MKLLVKRLPGLWVLVVLLIGICFYIALIYHQLESASKGTEGLNAGLAIEGIHEGKYTKAVLKWGTKAFNLFPGV